MSYTPPSLNELLEEPKYLQLKAWFIKLRHEFKANPQALIELEAYECGDNYHTYCLL